MMHRFVKNLARATALLGGFVLLVLILLTTMSILGRAVNKFLHNDVFDTVLNGPSKFLLDLGIGEINGSYELLEAGVAFAIFSFLPICQFYGVHATVDVFTSALPRTFNRWLGAFWEVILAMMILLLIWRLFSGLERYYGNGETTLFLQFPVWWTYACSFAAGVVACIVAVYCAAMRLREAATGRDYLPSEQGAH